jgi:hypothetical protein
MYTYLLIPLPPAPRPFAFDRPRSVRTFPAYISLLEQFLLVKSLYLLLVITYGSEIGQPSSVSLKSIQKRYTAISLKCL